MRCGAGTVPSGGGDSARGYLEAAGLGGDFEDFDDDFEDGFEDDDEEFEDDNLDDEEEEDDEDDLDGEFDDGEDDDDGRGGRRGR